ncbi:MAG TPA: enoyl-CoA hydratase/isomerase family protein [Pseudomonadales bacterium]|jgi:2-(1,2-epoxy-1,2-dihydrophenyl)acetyl-CoA isomerase|nr:enoyl-CoA hydratase [Gammaproteobacteria bacterium]MDP6027787.1 enoyl-CoA hydratase/isomerase family protein [Pseudomonadales bacterium]MDP6315397.1 enoyl-CoA hydratase/isomerase family protein [Pseudomonadales bacterium]MDP7315147.1 enoyl-CoA hydratase/isomerase family protein [Pseudomonadales bacterium]HJP50203.1 enoyl-CoA hydratase/isomerase family protein [Pseudomonadales bacterium]|tara:strand:- start:7886 stop:8686 length:801 start_codon:yes stop_codon:yes gene_type:complete
MMDYETINYETDEQIAIVTLNRPEKLNALNGKLRDELNNVCAQIYNNDDVRAVVFTGTGRGFCSGADLTGAVPRAKGTPTQNARLDEMGWVGKLATSVYEIGVPSIAAMNGVAAGAGMSISLACDMRVGFEGSRFRTVFAERGLSPDTGMSYFLPRIVGYARAADLIFTSRDVRGDEAYRIGLLDRLVDEQEILSTAIEIGKQISALPPMAIRSGKRVLQQNMSRDFHEALRNETLGLQFAGRAPNDAKEQRAAFVEKRKATFTGT